MLKCNTQKCSKALSMFKFIASQFWSVVWSAIKYLANDLLIFIYKNAKKQQVRSYFWQVTFWNLVWSAINILEMAYKI